MAHQRPLIVLIDGPSGAGKTTLARALAQVLGATLVHMDDFYPGWEGLAQGSAIVAQQVLHHHTPGFYRWDWQTNTPAEWVALPQKTVLVIEGVGAITTATVRAAQDNAQHVFRMLCDGPAQWRKERALARDPDYEPFWDMWAAQERKHFAKIPAVDLQLQMDTRKLVV